MKNRVRGLAAPTAALFGLLSFCVSTLTYAAGPGWYDNFEQATQAARQQGRPIFVDFSTSWCSICKQMDRTTLSDPDIVSRLDNFIKIKVDGDARPDLVSAYGVEAYPTFVHLDSGCRIVDKREGFMRSQELAGTLDRIWQSASASMAIAQANQKPAAGKNPTQSRQQASGQQQPATGGSQQSQPNMMLAAPPSESGQMEISTSAQGNRKNRDAAPKENLYNTADAQLQGNNVYAMESGPTSERRSRFGGSAQSSPDLRQLAEATANPSSLKADVATNEDVVASDDKLAPVEAEQTVLNRASDEPAEKRTQTEVTQAKAEIEKRATAKPAIVLASAEPPKIIQSRLAGLSESDLPKPLLSRTSSRSVAGEASAPKIADAAKVVEVANTAPTVPRSPTADPLATIKRLQGNDVGAKPTPVSTKPMTIAATTKVEEKAPQAAGDAAPAKEEKEPVIAPEQATEKTLVAPATKKSEPAEKSEKASSGKTEESSTKSKAADSSNSEMAKTSTGATRSDIERWMKDADSKLVSDRKKEARAMYSKVVDKDPKNQFGKSDTAYVKMVSLIVDRDSDSLRRQAYNKIKEFENRYPDSDHKDYYTLIRSILAVDLDEITEAQKLLSSFEGNFPDSKYLKIAKETLKSLPSAKKASTSSKSKSKSSANSGKRKSSNSDS